MVRDSGNLANPDDDLTAPQDDSSVETPADSEDLADGPDPDEWHSRKLIGLVAVVVLLIACGFSSLYDFGLGSDDDDDDEIFDVNNAPFHMLDHGVPISEEWLSDGKFYPDGGDGDDPHVRVKTPTEYVDMDGDQLTDAVATLEWTGTDDDDAWQALFIWIQDGDGEFTPVRWPGAWQWSCVAKTEGRELEAWSPTSPFGANVYRHSNNLCGADAERFGPGELSSSVVAVLDGIPVRDGEYEHSYATESCLGGDPLDPAEDVDFVELPRNPLPRLQPDPESPAVSGPDEDKATDQDGDITVKIAAETDPTAAELKARNGYVPAVITWWDDMQGCGWVEWDTAKSTLDGWD